MKNFTKMKSWLMLLVFGLMVTAPSAFAIGNIVDPPVPGDVEFPVEFSIGDVAKGDVWTPGQAVLLTNNSDEIATVTSIEFEASNEFFTFDLGENVLPFDLGVDETLEVFVSALFPSGTDNGTYATSLIASFGGAKGLASCEVSGEVYTPRQGDVWEIAIPTTANIGGGVLPFDQAAAGGAIKKNYEVGFADGNKDAVYKFTLEADAYFTCGETPVDVEAPFHFAVYNSDFDGEAGPMVDNTIAADDFIEAIPLFAGDYYVVVTYDNAEVPNMPSNWASYEATAMTVPAAVLKLAPVDEDTEVVNGDELSWEYADDQTQKYRVLLSTEIPLDPADDLFVDWTDASEGGDIAELTGLDNNQIYFWRVDLMNGSGETVDPNSWGFTTELNVPLDLVLDLDEAFTDDMIELSWTSPFGDAKALVGYNVYRDGVMLNATTITGTTFEDGPLAYNMVDPGYSYTVTAVFDEGESDPSAPVTVLVSGYGDISGNVSAVVGVVALENATVAYDGLDEFGNAVSSSVVTDDEGDYLIEDLEMGTYDFVVTYANYIDGTATGVVCPSTDVDFMLNEVPFAVDTVYAVAVANDIEVTWTMDSKELVNFDITREQVLGNPALAAPGTTDIGTTTGNIILDEAWIADTLSGVYAWGVVANYDANASDVVYSATVDKTMETEVDVIVTTEFGDEPVATVTFENVSELALELEYTTTLDATGLHTFENFRKGTYEYTVELVGYDDVTGTMDIWGHNTLDVELPGGTPPAQNLVADNDSLYLGDDVVLTWEASASSQFQGYIVYKNGVALFENPQSELTYTDNAPAYAFPTGHSYAVKAVYDGFESDEYSNVVEVKVTGEGAVAGYVMDGMDDSDLKDVTIRLDGFDEYGVAIQYSFVTDEDGEYASAGLINDGVLAGVYDVEVTKENYTLIEDAYAVTYNTVGTHNYIMYPSMTVTAVELDADNVQVTWSFDNVSKEILEYKIYRSLWTEEVATWEYLGLSNGQIFIDDSWGTVDYGAYKWAVQAIFDDGTSTSYSNVLLKDMMASAEITVTLNTLESAEGTEVELKYLNGFMDTTYMAELDATGVYTFNPIYKGEYDVKVKLFGYETIYTIVEVKSDTAFAYELIEQLNPVNNLYVTPNGFATWGVVEPGGVPEFVGDFNDGIPADVTVETAYGDGWNHYQQNDTTGYMYAPDEWTGHDSQLTLPIIEVEDDTYVIEFAWAMNYLTYFADNEFDVEISTNNGLTWASVWSMHDAGIYQYDWLQETIVLSDLGVTGGIVLVRFHSVDSYGSTIWLDNIYVGPAEEEAEKGSLVAATVGYQPTEKGSWSMEEFNVSTKWLVNFNHSTANSSKSFEHFKVALDDTFMADVIEREYDYEVNTTLVPGQEYTASVTVNYTSGISEEMTYDFVYLPCDSFNLVEDLTATRVLGTMDVNLAWANDNAFVGDDEFTGTNIYRDGLFVAFVEAGVVTYTDGDLASGTYNYCLTQVYDSEAESCETCASVTMTAGGFVEGYVYMYGTTTPIVGASVAIVGNTESYVFTTDDLGFYSGEVVNDTVTYTASMLPDYESVVVEDVIIDFGETVVKDFYLKEFPFAVGEVVAEELSEETVKVTWGEQAIPEIGEWLTYDDGANWNALGNNTALTMSWASKFDAAQLVAFNDCAVTKIEGYLGLGDDAEASIFVRVWAGADAATLLYEEDVTSQVVWDEYNTFTLTTPVEFDNADELWIGFYGESDAPSHPAGLSNTAEYNANGDLFNSGAGWTHANTLGAGDIVFNLSGYVTNQFGETVALASGSDNTEYKTVSSNSLEVITAAAPTYREEAVYANASSKELVGYNIYRGIKDGDAATDLELLGTTYDESFNDNTWGAAEWGIYVWAVEAVYTENASVLVYSNAIDKDMITVVDLIVTTSDGGSPAGASATFTNLIETEFEARTVGIPGSGLTTVDDFRRGTYSIEVAKAGYETITVESVVIHEATTFEWELIEKLGAPSDLYVTPTGLATWTGTTAPEFTPYMETFDAEDAFSAWEVVVGGSNEGTWYWNNGTNGQYEETLDGTPYAFVDSDDQGSGSTMDELLISPVIPTAGVTELYVTFDQFYRNLNAAEQADVEVFNGSEWVTVLHQAETAGEWSDANHVTIDVTEHANAEFRVRFHYVAPGWDWHWAVDNVQVVNSLEESAKSVKSLEDFLVYHETDFVASTEEPMHQYGEGDDVVLVIGETYLAEVASVYTTGTSPKASYSWTYLPCDSFPAYVYADAENVEGTNDVLVNWSMLGNGGGSGGGDTFTEDFESYEDFDIVYSPWTTIDVDGAVPYGFGGITFPNSDVPRAGIIFNPLNTEPALEGPLAVSGDKYLAIFNPMTPVIDADDWNITPQLTLGDDYVVSFYATGGNALYSAEKFQIFVSTGEAVAADMVAVSEVVTTPASSVEWIQYSYDLSDYAGEDVYVGLHCTSYDQFFLCVDDFYVGPATSMRANEIATNYSSAQASGIASKGVANGSSLELAPLSQAQMDARVSSLIKSAKSDADVFGTNIYRDAEFLVFVPAADTFYLDMELEPGIYEYCVATVYTMDAGAHTWESCAGANCFDVTVSEECVAPYNLTAEDLTGDGYTATLNWSFGAEAVEYRYDDGVSTGQLGSGTGTMNTVLGNVHRVDSELSEMSWYLTAEGGPHTNITVYVMGLDAAGLPDGTNVLYSALVSNTDEVWNTHTFPTAIDATGGFFLGVAGDGFVGVGTDDGTGDYPFELNTHYFVGDYTAGGWETWETYDFSVNAMIRAIGAPGSVASYAVQSTPGNTSMDFEATSLETAVSVGSPEWTKSTTDSRAFLGFNIYRDDVLIEEGYGSTTYLDDIGSSYEVCYYVTAQYEYCGESAATSTECVTPGVGFENLENVISVYPNPAKDYVTVEASSDILTIKVTNYMGQVISYVQDVEVTSHTIATSTYSSGVYFVEVETANGVEKVRIVISE